MKSIGKYGKEWQNAKISIRKEFDKLGIYYCEFRGIFCSGYGETFAHVLKRRHLGKYGSDERTYNMGNIARLCINCHNFLELLGEEVGGQEVQRIIDQRNEKFLFGDIDEL